MRPAAPAPTVTVVVPVHRDSPAFRRALAAVTRLDPPADEVVVAVDGPDDALAAVALEHGARVVQLARGQGPAVARNAAARAARGDVLFFVDADVVVRPDTVGLVRDHLARHPGVSAVIGTYDDEPADPGFFSQYKNLLNHHVHQTARLEGSTFWGACGAVRREAFEAVRGFDPRYSRPTVEDIELGYRLTDRGAQVHVVKALQVKHLKRWTARTLLRSDVRDRALPWSALILRTGRMPDDLNTDLRGRVAVTLTGLACAGLAAAPAVPAARVLVPAALAGVVATDWPLLRFLARHRGLPFAAGSAAWHVLHHAYSGGAFGVAVAHQVTGTPVWRYRAWCQRRERRRARAEGTGAGALVPAGAGVPRGLVAAHRHVPAGQRPVRVPVGVLELEPAPRPDVVDLVAAPRAERVLA